jgi:maleate isomerase
MYQPIILRLRSQFGSMPMAMPVSANTPAGRRRVGLIVPSSNTTMETELPELMRRQEGLCPGDITFHSARLRLHEVNAEELRRMNAEAARAVREVADARPHVVASACLVAIMAQGRGYHAVAEEEFRTVLAEEGVQAPAISSAGALIEALRALGAQRIGLVTPYAKPLTRLVADYLEDVGFTVADTVSLEVTDNRAVAALDPDDLREHWRRLDLADCDALVLSACVQMPSLSAIEAVEQAAGIPTLSAATATAWSVLRSLDLTPSVAGAGRLLSGAVPANAG